MRDSPRVAKHLHDHVLYIFVTEQHALLMDVCQQPVLICLQQATHFLVMPPRCRCQKNYVRSAWNGSVNEADLKTLKPLGPSETYRADATQVKTTLCAVHADCLLPVTLD